MGKKDGGFMVLANYIGAVGNPQNTKPEKIVMTALVITKGSGGEKVANDSSYCDYQADEKMVTMQFLLPAKYKMAEKAPQPVVIREEGTYVVDRFGGLASEKVVEEKVEKLKKWLEKDGYKIIGEFQLARYNPPWTLPSLRTNEDMIPVE
ncbi:SOUL heme-binding family protein [Tripterygium wilfordii]|uniref:SOUL heme-binding family protein n=2 Tax=Tripterygium wilfordii TaxID=458696 RepID=A0A7J7CT93_TRIWF|nr:SOUL heme-binding family protein [Tripterygium wilfordii]